MNIADNNSCVEDIEVYANEAIYVINKNCRALSNRTKKGRGLNHQLQ